MSDRPTTGRKSQGAGQERESIHKGAEPAELRGDEGGPGDEGEVSATLEATHLTDATRLTPPLPQYRIARAAALFSFERDYLRQLIETTGGNASAAARAANMDRPYLLSLLRRHGLR